MGENLFSSVLEIEFDPKILDFKIDGIPLWLLIRTNF